VQVRDEEEEEALEFIKRNRRLGDVELDVEELKMLEQRFSRIGKEKTQSGQAYQEMTKNVIVSGMSFVFIMCLEYKQNLIQTVLGYS
jgi:hypothetical protein